jgi:hypothetical protein
MTKKPAQSAGVKTLPQLRSALEGRLTAIKVSIIEPDKKKIRVLATNASQGTAGVPKIVVLEEISDEKKIEKMNLPETPAIVINGEVKSSGKILSTEEFRKLFLDYLQAARQ